LVLVEREDLQAVVDEIGIQYAGRVEDDTTVRVGKLTGADSLLTYRLMVNATGGQITASFELRLLNVESGINSFRQITTATATPSMSGSSTAWRRDSNQLTQRLVAEEATAYGMAALAAAFGDNSLGIVPDHDWPREGLKVLGILQGSPAYRAGLKQGDRILGSNDRPLRNWTDLLSLPALLRIERDGNVQEVSVE
jgi:membrane-associated protease RseP (regulator of RpoE activity)